MQTLFTSDRMILEGKIYYAKGSNNGEEYAIPYLYLQFIFQVNGKLCKHCTNFEMAMETDAINPNLSLKHWEEWYKILELFESMGYSFNENSNMSVWIDRLLEPEIGEYVPGRVIDSVSF